MKLELGLEFCDLFIAHLFIALRVKLCAIDVGLAASMTSLVIKLDKQNKVNKVTKHRIRNYVQNIYL